VGPDRQEQARAGRGGERREGHARVRRVGVRRLRGPQDGSRQERRARHRRRGGLPGPDLRHLLRLLRPWGVGHRGTGGPVRRPAARALPAARRGLPGRGLDGTGACGLLRAGREWRGAVRGRARGHRGGAARLGEHGARGAADPHGREARRAPAGRRGLDAERALVELPAPQARQGRPAGGDLPRGDLLPQGAAREGLRRPEGLHRRPLAGRDARRPRRGRRARPEGLPPGLRTPGLRPLLPERHGGPDPRVEVQERPRPRVALLL
ncbi:MAG: 5-deoxy-glucuronate isomerase, partial [uncultured Rubrobacteraceae bacterium]